MILELRYAAVTPTAFEQAEALYRQGDAAHDAQQFSLARHLLEAALKADPDHWLARYTLAVVLQDLGRHDAAVPLYEEALAAKGDHLKAWNNYGIALQYSGRREAAINAFQELLKRAPGDPNGLANLSGLLAETGRTEEARALLTPYCNAGLPNLFDLRRALMVAPVARSVEELDARRQEMLGDLQRIAAHPPSLIDPMREVGRTPFYLAYQPASNRTLLEQLATLYRKACPDLSFIAPNARRSNAQGGKGEYDGLHRRVRIAFASFFLYEHSVGRVMRGLIEHLPRERFEIVAIFLGGKTDDPVSRAIAGAADQVIETAYALIEARQAIADADLDVLVLPDFGLEPLSYFLGFARLAPVQCTTWGHAETSGLDTIDWFVSTEGFERPGAEVDYTERLYRLPAVASPAYYDRPVFPDGGTSRIADKDTSSAVANFLCLQTVYKLHPDFDVMLSGILSRLPSARIYLVRSNELEWNLQLKQRLEVALGGLSEQVCWLEPMSRADYRATIIAADVILDSPYFTGGITSLDAFALDKPVLTLQGSTMRSRFTAGFYRAMGLSSQITDSPDDYVCRAVILGENPALRADQSAQIAARKGILFNDSRVLSAWTEFFEFALRSI